MSPVEIIFVSLGIFLLLVSCFVTGRKAEPEAVLAQLPLELTEEQKQKLEKEIDHIFEERTDHLVIKADDYMSKISNEKIMAVHDFTAQIMEKIDYNHREVVFLYDMLNQKEAEIKETAQTLEEKRKGLKESVEDAIHLTKQLNAAIRNYEEKAEQLSFEEKTAQKKASTGKTPGKKASLEEISNKDTAYEAKSIESQSFEKAEKSSGKKTTAKTKAKMTKKEKAASAEEQTEISEMIRSDNMSEEILRLHRQGKSILEISKALGLGQGEVKLVIDLYGSI